jgi:hypothetical protein
MSYNHITVTFELTNASLASIDRAIQTNFVTRHNTSWKRQEDGDFVLRDWSLEATTPNLRVRKFGDRIEVTYDGDRDSLWDKGYLYSLLMINGVDMKATKGITMMRRAASAMEPMRYESKVNWYWYQNANMRLFFFLKTDMGKEIVAAATAIKRSGLNRATAAFRSEVLRVAKALAALVSEEQLYAPQLVGPTSQWQIAECLQQNRIRV